MSKKRITITEAELRDLVKESIEQTLNEGFKDTALRLGKSAAKGAIGAGLALGGMYLTDKGLENEYQRNQMNNAKANMEVYQDDPEIRQWVDYLGLDPKDPNSWVKAAKKAEMHQGDTIGNDTSALKEARAMRLEKKINRIVNESVNRALKRLMA